MTDQYEFKKLKPLQHPAGWTILPIHFSHDDSKNGPWADAARAMYDRDEDWQREMNMDFTAQLGAAAYPSFSRVLHVKEKLPTSRELPLCVACDFNVDDATWEVCQIRNGRLLVVDEIHLGETDIPKMVEEFRNRYPDHPAGVNFYGDPQGTRRNMQTGRSEFQLIQIHMQGYPSPVSIKASRASPVPRARIDSVNHKLKGFEGKPGILIASHCKELISDCEEVALRPDGKDVRKSYKDGDPYKARTHASDAIGYLVYREWPLVTEAAKLLRAKQEARKPLKYKGLLKP